MCTLPHIEIAALRTASAAFVLNFEERTGKHRCLVVQVGPTAVLQWTRAVTRRLQLVDGLQLEIFMVDLAEHSILVVSPLADDG